MPVWLIVLLAVFAVLLVATVVVGATLLVRNASPAESGEARAGDVASPSPEAEETESEGTEPDDDELVSTLDLDEGDCFQLPDDEDNVDGVELVACGRPHEAEVYAELDIKATSFPGDEAADELATDWCEEQFDAFVGMAYADSVLDFYYFYPSMKTWTYGDRTVTCAILEPTGPEGEDLKPVTGTLRNARR